MKLIDNWRQGWRMFSNQAMVAAIAVQSTWELVPPDMKTALPPKFVYALTVGLLAFGILGRLVKQDSVKP